MDDFSVGVRWIRLMIYSAIEDRKRLLLPFFAPDLLQFLSLLVPLQHPALFLCVGGEINFAIHLFYFPV